MSSGPKLFWSRGDWGLTDSEVQRVTEAAIGDVKDERESLPSSVSREPVRLQQGLRGIYGQSVAEPAQHQASLQSAKRKQGSITPEVTHHQFLVRGTHHGRVGFTTEVEFQRHHMPYDAVGR
ncbi:hypothetical protein LOD99_8836 [Oopsacas minuta]|uniref:Uncharacterized protein n=1 Tax=Oopsacas minuta TaxID=111878 RepID=A0AAV7JEE9_9METZ|nr:hypothetical protein LOD99_8836 [Oopsacas minuta]